MKYSELHDEKKRNKKNNKKKKKKYSVMSGNQIIVAKANEGRERRFSV